NRTTIENTQFQSWNKDRKKGQRSKPVEGFTQHGKNVFNHGWRDNWLEVMSSNIILWFLPLSLKGNNTMDGIHHKYNAIILEEYLNEDKANLCNTV
ncbi:uncharacterized protein B0P05DRAFT_230353, partial [Gilbertella persicaria]|uniref:uncharacterized protein n=1 Tax=Gilbertella persicaria TaxID=101096 RepID=UPI00221F48FC